MTLIELIENTIDSLREQNGLGEHSGTHNLPEMWLKAMQGASVSINDFQLALGALKASKAQTVTSDMIISEVKKEKSQLKEAVTNSFRGWVAQFPSQMGRDGDKVAQKIFLWVSELATHGISAKEYLELKEILAKDAKFVVKPPEISDFLQIRKQNNIYEEYSNTAEGASIVDATKRLSRTFDHRYHNRWTKPDIAEANERLETWIKHFNMFNLTAESIDKAVEMTTMMSEFNRFAPSLQDFTIICKLAMCGEDIPGPHDAYLIASGLVRNKVPHKLITYAANQIGAFELRNGKINKDAFIAVYQNAILEYSASGEIPLVTAQALAQETTEIDESGPVDACELVSVIDKLLEEVENEQYF